MPAKDIFHDCVKHALIKDGWIVTDDPLSLKIGKKDLFIDLAAEKILMAEKGTEKIAVEIKSFIGTSEVEDLKNALGKYVLYEKIIKRQQIEAEVSQLKEDVKDLKERATAQIWALIVTVIGATVAAIIKFGFLTKT